MHIDESISVSSIIDKLPPKWKDFKHTLKHGNNDLSLVQLGSHLRIEEALRSQETGNGIMGATQSVQSNVHMVEHSNRNFNNNNNNKRGKGKRKFSGKFQNSNKKPKDVCWRCRKPRHIKRDCRVQSKVGKVATDVAGTSGSKDPPGHKG